MQIKIFMNSANNEAEQTLLIQFADGVQRWINSQQDQIDQRKFSSIGRWRADQQHSVDYVYGDEYEDCDVAVIFGSAKPREKGHHLVRSSVFARSNCFIVIETPLLARSTSNPNEYWRIGVNGYLNTDTSWPIPTEGQSRKYLFDVNKWQGWNNNPDGHILLALQLPGDASMRGRDVVTWAYDTISKLREHTNREIRVRSHPLTADRGWTSYANLLAKLISTDYKNINFSDGAKVQWEDDLKDAYCTVAFTSGLSVDSVVNGIPVLPGDPGNFVWNFSSHHPNEINQLVLAPGNVIESWLENLSWAQWSGNEMQSGAAWQALLPILNND